MKKTAKTGKRLGQVMMFTSLALSVSALSAGYAILSAPEAAYASGEARYLPESPYAKRRATSLPESLMMDAPAATANDTPLMPPRPSYAPPSLQPAPVLPQQPVMPAPLMPQAYSAPQPLMQQPVAPQAQPAPYPEYMPDYIDVPQQQPVSMQPLPAAPSFALPQPPAGMAPPAVTVPDPAPQPMMQPVVAPVLNAPYERAQQAAVPQNLHQQPLPVQPVSPPPSVAPVMLTDGASLPATLSEDSKKILNRIPKQINPEEKTVVSRNELRRYDPEIEGILSMPVDGESTDDETGTDGHGVSIRVRRPSLNAGYELQKAYEAMRSGETWIAIEIYKDVLKEQPANQDALFGIATAFQRTGELDWARPFYDKLLRVNPRHADGLNNLLVLVAEESPQEALSRLHELEKSNPDFAPIQAQLGLLYHQNGEFDKARYHLLRAIRLEPGDIDYKYNLAIIFDEQGDAAEAVVLYRKLLQAARNGEQLPADAGSIEERVIYLTNQANAGK
jgi:Tfp pilus assembly protein PilF